MKSPALRSAYVVLTLSCLAILPMGCKKVPPVKLACNASAPSIYPGDPQTITATPQDVAQKKNWNVTYEWSGQNVTGNGTTATVDTSALEPGNYTVKGVIKEGKKGKEGIKPNQTASCQADYTVKPFEPPTVSCTANPTSVTTGESSTISCNGVSPQNRPLTYSYSASAGSVSGTGNSATLSTTGAPSGSITVTCNVQDDKGHTASATATVDVQAPPPPPAPKSQALCTVQFDRDKRRPARVDNEGKACLDDMALNAQQKPDATLVVVGDSAPIRARRGRHAMTTEKMAAQRAVNVKDYLVNDKGIDASRIQVRTGTSGQNEVQDYLVPSGANFDSDVPGTTAVDESSVKPQPRTPRHHHHHHKAAAASK